MTETELDLVLPILKKVSVKLGRAKKSEDARSQFLLKSLVNKLSFLIESRNVVYYAIDHESNNGG